MQAGATSTPAIGRPSWSVSRPRASPTAKSSISPPVGSAAALAGRAAASRPGRPGRGRTASRLRPCPGGLIEVHHPRQEIPALIVGRRPRHDVRREPVAVHPPDLDARHPCAGPVHDPAGQVIRTRFWRIGLRRTPRPSSGDASTTAVDRRWRPPARRRRAGSTSRETSS